MNQTINKIIASLPFLNKDSKDDNKTVITKKIVPKNKNLLGRVLSFYITDKSIQMAATQHLGNKIKVLDVHTIQLIGSEPKPELEYERQNIIADYISQYSSKFTKYILTIPGHNITFRNIIMPDLKENELRSAVTYEADKLVPFPLEEAFYDYRKTFKIESTDKSKIKLILHAAHKRIVESQKIYFDNLKKPLFRIYHSQDTMGRLLPLINNFDDDKKYILMNIGHDQTDISFYKGSVLEFTHSAFINSDTMGIKSENPNYEYFAESIVNEIQNSIDYSGQFTVNNETSIFVYGDFAGIDRLYNLLNKITSYKITPFPLDKISLFDRFDEKEKEQILIGLSPVAAGVNKRNLADLLPPEEKEAIKTSRTNNYLKTITTAVLVAAFLSWSYFNSKVFNETAQLNNMRTELATFVSSDAYHTYNKLKREILFDQNFMNQVQKEPSFLALHLKELSNLTSTSIKLISFEYTPNLENHNFFLQGLVKSNGIPPEIILAEYIETLKDSPLYDDVRIVKHIKKMDKENGMEVEFTIKMLGLS